MTTTPTEPTGHEHEDVARALFGHVLYEGNDPDGPSACGCALDEPTGVFDENDPSATKRWHAEHLAEVLSSAGFLATEQEWGVRFPSGNVQSYGADETRARRFSLNANGLRPDLPTLVVRKAVTAWVEVGA